MCTRPAEARSAALPGALWDAVGQPDYYQQRADDFRRRNPKHPIPKYYLSYGDKYSRRFSCQLLQGRFSASGRRFVRETHWQLQAALERIRHRDPVGFAEAERDGAALHRLAFGTHGAAYLAAGVWSLSLRDQLRLISTIDLADLICPLALREVAVVLLHAPVGVHRLQEVR